MPREHPCGRLRAEPSREVDDGGPVARRDVPALQAQPVGGREADVLVRDAQRVRGHVRALDVRDGIGEQHRLSDEERRQKLRRRASSARRMTRRSRLPSRRRERHSVTTPIPSQQQAGGDGQQPGEVVTGRADGGGVVAGLEGADTHAEDTHGQRQQAAPPRPHPPVRPGGRRQQRHRDEPAGQVVGRGGACRRLQEAVVHDVQRDERRAEQEQRALVAQSPPRGPCRSGRRGAGRDGRGRHASTLGTRLAERPGGPPQSRVVMPAGCAAGAPIKASDPTVKEILRLLR